jgi:2-oxoglutarate ferredoxin oxidoreductase subunit alpha
MKAGYNFGDTAEMFPVRYKVNRAALKPGKYRSATGNQLTAIGLITAAKLMNKPLFYGTYPITPASDILHELSSAKNFDVRTFQAEDEIAAVCSAIGASFAGALGSTASSGPGIALKQEAIGLAVITELPLLIVDVQRGGPSTGLPTKTEQADLWQVMLGRNGECPVPVIAPRSPSDCFWCVLEAAQWAVKYMTPVFILSDGYLANGAEPWLIPSVDELPKIEVKHASDPAKYQSYLRDEFGSRPWAIPGMKGLEHRVGGLEKDVTGNVNYDPENHQKMTDLRAQKVANIANDIPAQEIDGPQTGDLLLVSWGGTYGAVCTAAQRARNKGRKVSHMHLRHMNPMPHNVGEILRGFKKIVVCELNMGQLQLLIRGKFAVDALGLHKVQGRPFMIREITEQIDQVLGNE